MSDDADDMPRSEGEAFEQIFRAVASLQVGFDKVARNQDSLKIEVKTIAPRLDALGTRMDTLAAELAALVDRVHAANNLVVLSLDEAARIHEEHNVLDRALDHFEHELKSRTGTLARAQGTLEKMIEVLEMRVGRLRDSLIPDAPSSTRDLPETPSARDTPPDSDLTARRE